MSLPARSPWRRALPAFPGLGLLLSLHAAPVALFDGESLTGWHSKHPERWRVEDGAIVSGDGAERIPNNFFLFTEKSFADFEFRCEFRLTGDPKTGLINSGIQFRSRELPNGHARGYQADIGDPEWWGGIYDEHRRNATIAKPDLAKILPAVKRNDWNEYVIRCEGARSRLWINGVLSVDFIEPDQAIPREGKIAVQIHSGGAAKVEFRNLTIEEFARRASPLPPADQLRTFTVPEGYVVELVASEESGLPKPITVSFDDAGRMWAITATEYPVDGNESPARATALWERGGRDRVVVFDDPLRAGPHRPRTFAEGLAMPMGILPWKDGAIVGHGPEILFLGDADRDGKADSRTVLVKGFGVQDSHLLPHQFTMMPGGWIAMAQGAFNRSQVVAGEEAPVSFDFCKIGRFRPDGSAFETIACGLNNIWGLVLGREGEMFIQEANDMNYSVVPFQVGSNYPGIGNRKFKPYAPFAPPIADFRLGGTGLSGLALCDDRRGSFPAPWHEVMFVANPITGTINAVRVHSDDEGGLRLERLQDFLECGDEWFRPIAIQFGPDGCLYIVDWYNKIISHNEVPRSHPARDKTRGRIWRVRHKSQDRRSVPDLTQVSDSALLVHLRSDSTWAMRAAWRQIVFRNATALAPGLKSIAANREEPADARIHALWALRDLGLADREFALQLAGSTNRNIRREAAAVTAHPGLADDPDPQVRAQAIRTLARSNSPEALAALIAFAKPALKPSKDNGAKPWDGRHGQPLPAGPVYDRAFERYLVRAALERSPTKLAAFLDSPAARRLPAENRLFASLSLPPGLSTARFVRAWVDVDRAPDDEELLLLLRGAGDPQLAPIVTGLFADPDKAPVLLEAVLRIRERVEATSLSGILTPAVQRLAGRSGNAALVVDLISSFRLSGLKATLVEIAESPQRPVRLRDLAVQAMTRIEAGDDPVILRLASSPDSPAPLRLTALAAAGSSGRPSAHDAVIEAMKSLSPQASQDLLARLAGSVGGSRFDPERHREARHRPRGARSRYPRPDAYPARERPPDEGALVRGRGSLPPRPATRRPARPILRNRDRSGWRLHRRGLGPARTRDRECRWHPGASRRRRLQFLRRKIPGLRRPGSRGSRGRDPRHDSGGLDSPGCDPDGLRRIPDLPQWGVGRPGNPQTHREVRRPEHRADHTRRCRHGGRADGIPRVEHRPHSGTDPCPLRPQTGRERTPARGPGPLLPVRRRSARSLGSSHHRGRRGVPRPLG